MLTIATQGHRRKRRKDRSAAFFDIEAEVDDEDEGEEDEKEGEEIGDFIDNEHPDDTVETDRLDDDRRHRELDRQRELESSMDAEKQAEILRQRYGNRRSARGFGDSAIVPKRLLMPSVDDPTIWAVRCKEGKEREVVFSIQKRIQERMGTKEELAIISAFERGGVESVMKGYIYVEANRSGDIMAALDGMLNVYPRSKMILVEIKDRPDLLRITKTPTLEPGAWVRLKRPAKHAGDLAQVIDLTENGLEARVRFIPRLDYGIRDEPLANITADGKRKRPIGQPGPRPPQRLFNEAEARKRHPRHIQGNPSTKTWSYMGEDFENGFQVKDVKIQLLTVTDVNPTLEEVTRFASGAEDGTENLDLKALAASLKDSNASTTYLPGDIIEVYAGEQRGVVGKASHVQGDIVTLHVTEGELTGQTIEVPIKGLRKRFKEGDHVKVIGGSRFRDEVGMVVKIVDDRVTFVTDQSNTEVTEISKDLREASDSGGQGSIGQYELLDLVQLNPTTVGCVVKVERESLVVLDQNGDTRQLMPSQIANKIPKRKIVVAADRNGSEIRLDDVVREQGGQQRQGKIIHIYRSFIYLHSHDRNDNAGVFVTRASNVTTVAAKGGRVVPTGPNLDEMNPAMKRNPNGGTDNKMMPPKTFGRDRALGQTVIIRRGGYKGLLGIVKDTTETHARVELHTKSKTVSVPKDHLSYKDKNTGAKIEINQRGPRPVRDGGFGGASRGTDYSGGRTPMASERTPAWGSRSKFFTLPTFLTTSTDKPQHRALLVVARLLGNQAQTCQVLARLLGPTAPAQLMGMAAAPLMAVVPGRLPGSQAPKHRLPVVIVPTVWVLGRRLTAVTAGVPRLQHTEVPPPRHLETRGTILAEARVRTMPPRRALVSALPPQEHWTPLHPAHTPHRRLAQSTPLLPAAAGKAAGEPRAPRRPQLRHRHQLRAVSHRAGTTAPLLRLLTAPRRRQQPAAPGTRMTTRRSLRNIWALAIWLAERASPERMGEKGWFEIRVDSSSNFMYSNKQALAESMCARGHGEILEVFAVGGWLHSQRIENIISGEEWPKRIFMYRRLRCK